MPKQKRDEFTYFGQRITAIDRQIEGLKEERHRFEEAQAVFKPKAKVGRPLGWSPNKVPKKTTSTKKK